MKTSQERANDIGKLHELSDTFSLSDAILDVIKLVIEIAVQDERDACFNIVHQVTNNIAITGRCCSGGPVKAKCRPLSVAECIEMQIRRRDKP